MNNTFLYIPLLGTGSTEGTRTEESLDGCLKTGHRETDGVQNKGLFRWMSRQRGPGDRGQQEPTNQK